MAKVIDVPCEVGSSWTGLSHSEEGQVPCHEVPHRGEHKAST